MSVVTAIEEREVAKRRALEERIADLRARRVLAARDHAAARELLLEDASEENKRAFADAETMVAAIDSKITELGRDVRRLQAFGDDQERKRHAAKLDVMRVEHAELRERQSARAVELGAELGRLVAALRAELRSMAVAEQASVREAKSLASFLDPTLTAHELVGLGLGESGFDGLRRRARDAMIRATGAEGLSREDLRVLFDL